MATKYSFTSEARHAARLRLEEAPRLLQKVAFRIREEGDQEGCAVLLEVVDWLACIRRIVAEEDSRRQREAMLPA